MSKATIEDKLIVMDGFLRLGSKSITVDDYDGLRELLGAAVADWSLTRLRRTVGSLHHNDRVIRIARKGEPMRDMYRPYVFLVTGRLKLKELALTAR